MKYRVPNPGLRLQHRDPDFPTSSSRPPSDFVTITLTPVNGAVDIREIQLHLDEPRVIGRASRNKQKGLSAEPNNALFDCPVVSRHHAELELVRSQGLPEIVIRDIGSMHGTKVNGRPLKAHNEWALARGDVIKLGEQIVRHQDSHDGVMLSFGYSSQDHRSQSLTQPSRSFTVPNYTDDEDESGADSDDPASPRSEVQQASSAKTTPEQRKVIPGTSGSPIDVDKMPPRKAEVIDLAGEDFDDDRDPFRTHPNEALGIAETIHQRPHSTSTADVPTVVPFDNSLEVVPETADDNMRAPESLSRPPPSLYMDLYIESESGPEDHDYEFKQTSQHEEREEEDDEDDEDDYPDADEDDVEEDEEVYAPSEFDEVLCADEEEEEEEAPEVYSSKRQSSPELGTPVEVFKPQPHSQILHSPIPNYTPSYNNEGLTSKSSAPFDPVRDDHSYHGYSPQSQQPQLPTKQKTYSTPFDLSIKERQADSSGSTRWDVPPAATAIRGRQHSPFRADLSPFNPPTSWEAASGDPDLSLYPRPDNPVLESERPAFGPVFDLGGSAPRELYPNYAYEAIPAWRYDHSLPAELHPAANLYCGTYPPAWQPMKAPVKPTAVNKITISDIVERDATKATDGVSKAFAEAMVDMDANKEVMPDFIPSKTVKLPITIGRSGKKRKADEMLAAEPVVPQATEDAIMVNTATSEAQAANTNTDDLPPAPKRRIASVARVAGTAAGGIVAGSLATMAFLCSPLAEKAIEWLT